MKKIKNSEVRKKETVSRKSSVIFLQLGLVFALLLTYVAIESKSIVSVKQIADNSGFKYDETDFTIPDTTPETPKETPKKAKIPEPTFDEVDIMKNDSKEEETEIDITLFDKDELVKTFDYSSVEDTPIDEEIIENVPIIAVEEMPVFPGCKGNREELQKCLSKKIGKIVAKNFDVDLAQEIGLTPGKKKIYVMFVIDKEGNISNIKSNAPHTRLKEETLRVLHKIPKIKPGKLNGKKVGVKYSMPITYQVVE